MLHNPIALLLILLLCVMAMAAVGQSHTPAELIGVAVYYFPNYHPGDARNAKLKGAGWSEWELVRGAKPRFPAHEQPKVPLWGYGDEADPKVMAQKIDAAADNGVDAFIFDWYYQVSRKGEGVGSAGPPS